MTRPSFSFFAFGLEYQEVCYHHFVLQIGHGTAAWGCSAWGLMANSMNYACWFSTVFWLCSTSLNEFRTSFLYVLLIQFQALTLLLFSLWVTSGTAVCLWCIKCLQCMPSFCSRVFFPFFSFFTISYCGISSSRFDNILVICVFLHALFFNTTLNVGNGSVEV